MTSIKRIITSVKNGIIGLRSAFKVDYSFRLEVLVGPLGYMFVMYCLWPLQSWEIIVLLLSYFLILITELINTSIETLLERLHPLRHNLIGTGKDIAAASVLVAYLFATPITAWTIPVSTDV